MKKPDIYDILGALADAAAKKSAQQKNGNISGGASEKTEAFAENKAPQNAPQKTPSPAPLKRSFADRKTVVEMIRRHDELSRKISENAKDREA